MASVSAQTRHRLTIISGLIEANLVHEASTQLSALIRTLPRQELVLASHAIRHEIDRLLKRRRRDLLLELDTRLSTIVQEVNTYGDGKSEQSPSPSALTIQPFNVRVQERLRDLARNHIFEWSPHYRDALGFMVDSALNDCLLYTSDAADE